MDLSKLKYGEKYNISTVEEIGTMTREQFSFFIEDLVAWFGFVKLAEDFNKDAGYDVARMDTKTIPWIYDSKKEVHAKITEGGGEKVIFDGVIKY